MRGQYAIGTGSSIAGNLGRFLFEQLAHARNDIGRGVDDLGHDRLHRFARVGSISIPGAFELRQRRVFHRSVEGPPQRCNAIGRHARRREYRPAGLVLHATYSKVVSRGRS